MKTLKAPSAGPDFAQLFEAAHGFAAAYPVAAMALAAVVSLAIAGPLARAVFSR